MTRTASAGRRLEIVGLATEKSREPVIFRNFEVALAVSQSDRWGSFRKIRRESVEI